MNLERLLQMVLRVVVARTVGLVVNRAFGWLERRGKGAAARAADTATAPAPGSLRAGDDPSLDTPAPAPGLDTKRLRQQMRMISRIGRMR